MHVCGSHEQAIARFGLRASFPRGPQRDHGAGLPGLHHRPARSGRGGGAGAPGRAHRDLRRHGARAGHGAVAGRRPGRRRAHRGGLQRRRRRSSWRAATDGQVVFFATGFETTAVATAAVDPAATCPPNFSVLSAHKYIPPVMEIVAEMPETRVEGFLAAGHAATITGWGMFEPFVERHGLPGRRRRASSRSTSWPASSGWSSSCATAARRSSTCSRAASRARATSARRRSSGACSARSADAGAGIAHVPNGNLRLRDEWAHLDARRRFRDRSRRAVGRRAAGARAPSASAATSCPASSTRPTARCSARSAFPTRRWAPAWCQQRGHLPDLAPVRRASGPGEL